MASASCGAVREARSPSSPCLPKPTGGRLANRRRLLLGLDGLCSSWRYPGSSSVEQLPRIAVGLRVASRSRVVLSRSPLKPWPSSLPSRRSNATTRTRSARLLKLTYVHVRSSSEKLTTVDGSVAVDRVTELIKAGRLALAQVRPRPGERLEGVTHKTQGPSRSLIP